MAGIFSKDNRPSLPGAYVNYVAKPKATVPISDGTAVAIPITHDWGPADEVVRCASFPEFQAIFGASDDTDGYRGVRQIFEGEDVDGRGGAGEAVIVRMVGTAAAPAEATFDDVTDPTPVEAITIEGVYPGTRGNDLRITIQDHAADSDFDELIVLDGTRVLETFVYEDEDITDLAAQINGTGDYVGQASNWVRATDVTSGVGLDPVSAVALTGGNDGTTLLSADWTGAAAQLAVEPFAVFAAYKLTDDTIAETLVGWAVGTPEAPGLNLTGKRFFALFGGAAAETLSTAVARTEDHLVAPDVINVGIGTVTDSELGPNGEPYDLSTSESLARVAGALAARGEYMSMTHARFSRWTIKAGATPGELLSAFDGGVMAYARDSHPTAPVHIKTGVTTWRKSDAAADPSKPYRTYRNPKYVRTMHGIETDLTSNTEENILGLRPINNRTREGLIGDAKSVLGSREEQSVIQPGWTVGIDQDPPPTDEDEFVGLSLGVSFGRSLEQVFFTIAAS